MSWRNNPSPDARTGGRRRGWLPAASLLVLALATACTHRPPRLVPTVPAAPLRRLHADLNRLFDGPAFRHAIVGAVMETARTGTVLYARHPDTLLLPASNLKILTLAAAADRLGWNFTYETKLVAAGPIADGALHGDLLVIGSGDPTIDGRDPASTDLFARWADSLWQSGLRRIDGRIIGDGCALDEPRFGSGWAWDDLPYGFAAPISALQYHDNLVVLTIHPGPSAGAPATVEMMPDLSGLVLANRLTTTAAGSAPVVGLRRAPGTDTLELDGTVPAGHPDLYETASVPDPPAFFARALRAALVARGIEVGGNAVDLDAAPPAPDAQPATVLIDHRSPPLTAIATVMMKVSENLYAETLLRTLGAKAGTSAMDGPAVVRAVLEGWGFPADRFVIADGSGLSRYDLVTAGLLAGVLRHLAADPRGAADFAATLPIGGVDGTLAHRFEGAAGPRVIAKTGSMMHVRALSGYVTARDGRRLVFSILVNNFDGDPLAVDAAIDAAVRRLAAFPSR